MPVRGGIHGCPVLPAGLSGLPLRARRPLPLQNAFYAVDEAGDGGRQPVRHLLLVGGEVEPVLLSTPDGLWLSVGSDHTDRKVETAGITISKQMCAKPVASAAWKFDAVSAHWDELIVRSWVTRSCLRTLYQEGPLRKMRHPTDLIGLYGGDGLPSGTVMFCGTLAVHGEIAPAEVFDMEIEDPVLKRRITHSYRPIELPIAG